MQIPTADVKELREQSGAGIMDCRNALLETKGDMQRALELLQQQGFSKAQKKLHRSATQGLIEAYIHTGGRIGVMVEVNCETDFVARTDEFRELAHNLAMQVAACPPQCISEDEIPEGSDAEPQSACLLLQPYIRDPGKTIKDVITEVIAKVGENIKVSRFSRFELGSSPE